MVEEIKSITSSIVTHKEKLWVTASQAPPGGMNESTFSSDGKMSPTSILCTVEVATSTPPVPPTEDKAVSTESVAVDSKMAECISKLKTVSQRLEQYPSGAAVHPAPGPIYTRTQHKPVCTVTQSPERAAKVKVTSRVTSSPEKAAKVTSTTNKDTRPKLMVARDSPTSSTDSGPESPTSSMSRGRKARKQCPDLSQMLRSATATANRESAPLPANAVSKQPTKGKVSPSGQPLITKMDMNIKDYRKHSPGVKRRSRLKQTVQITSKLEGKLKDGTVPQLCNVQEEKSHERKKTPEELNDEQCESDTNMERHDVKAVLSNKVDVNYLPTEDIIRRTEKPVVRKLPPQIPRLKEKDPVKIEPTKVHVEWHKRRILTRQLSLDDIHRRGSVGGGPGGWNGGSGGGGGSGQALQGLIPLPVDYPQRPMMSFNYHRSTGQLQVKVPEEGSAAFPSNPPPARINRRASIDVAGIGRGGVLPPSAPRRGSLIVTPEISTVNEDVPLPVNNSFSEEENISASKEQSDTKKKQTDSLEDKNQTNRPLPPPRRKTQYRRGSVA